MALLAEETRGGILENTHEGRICVTDENGTIVASVGNPQETTFYRSASKLFQALPVLVHGLEEQYGLSEAEIVALSGSLAGQPCHLEAVLSILKKTGFAEEDFIVLPSYPGCPQARDEMIRQNLPPRKALHNCAGKHLGAMMLQKHFTGDHRDYWQVDSAAQQEILRYISMCSNTPVEEVSIGIDGCGVPVFAVPLVGIAKAYRLMACPDRIEDAPTRKATEKIVPMVHRHPEMMRGYGFLCSIFNEDPNIIAKGGAEGVYGFGLKKERLGVALKIADGSERVWPLLIAEILRQLGYQNQETFANLDKLCPPVLYNSNNTPVGLIKPAFQLF